MSSEEAGSLSGKEFDIEVFGKAQKHSLPENMTIEKFKSFVLTLTGNKPFYLNAMMCNEQALSDLAAKGPIKVFEKSSKFDLKYN